MPKFRAGAPQVAFQKKDGSYFVNTFHSRDAAARAIKGYRSKGGRVLGVRRYSPNRSRSNRNAAKGRSF